MHRPARWVAHHPRPAGCTRRLDRSWRWWTLSRALSLQTPLSLHSTILEVSNPPQLSRLSHSTTGGRPPDSRICFPRSPASGRWPSDSSSAPRLSVNRCSDTRDSLFPRGPTSAGRRCSAHTSAASATGATCVSCDATCLSHPLPCLSACTRTVPALDAAPAHRAEGETITRTPVLASDAMVPPFVILALLFAAGYHRDETSPLVATGSH